MNLDWTAVSTHEVMTNGEYDFVVSNVNDIIYQYELTVTLNAAYSADTIAALANAIKPPTPTPAPALPAACASLQADFDAANGKLSTIQAGLSGLLPTKQSDGKFASIPLNQTLNQWDAIRNSAASYVAALNTLKMDLSNNSCTSAAAPQLVYNASQLITDYSTTLQPQLQRLDSSANGAHVLQGEGFLDRTRGGSLTVRELYGGSDTEASPKTFPLEATYSVITISGGFLLTTLPALSYASVNQPPTTASGTTTTVLGVSGNSGIRPALTALVNVHDPFSWFGNKPNFGFAISAGPVIEVANGQADTSKFGFFGGVSAHLWKQVFITPGIHVGQFAGFPEGFSKPGQPIPPNFGALVPTNRYSARFGFAITFRGSNPASLLGTGGTPKTSSQAPATNTATSGPKQ
jgi:hypothetical protein